MAEVPRHIPIEDTPDKSVPASDDLPAGTGDTILQLEMLQRQEEAARDVDGEGINRTSRYEERLMEEIDKEMLRIPPLKT